MASTTTGHDKKDQRIAAEALVKAARIAANARKREAKQNIQSPVFKIAIDENLAKFEHLLSKQKALGISLFDQAPQGMYAIETPQGKSLIDVRDEAAKCIWSNFGLQSSVFVPLSFVNGVKAKSVARFQSSYTIPEHAQKKQKELHTFLRTAYEASAWFELGLVESFELAKKAA